jgi:hypothetical protein
LQQLSSSGLLPYHPSHLSLIFTRLIYLTSHALYWLIISLVFMLQEYALKVIAETNEAWAKLVKRSVPAGELSLA